MGEEERGGKRGKPLGKAQEAEISLSQAILGPLDAVFKAQLHASRSFLNLLLQLGFPEVSEKDEAAPPFTISFKLEDGKEAAGTTRTVKVPALALLPIQPLAIHSAEFELNLNAKSIHEHEQMQPERLKDGQKRPWYLVQEPISIHGVLAPGKGDAATSPGANIRVLVKIDKAPIPSGLDKLLVTLTELSEHEAGTPGGAPAPGGPNWSSSKT